MTQWRSCRPSRRVALSAQLDACLQHVRVRCSHGEAPVCSEERLSSGLTTQRFIFIAAHIERISHHKARCKMSLRSWPALQLQCPCGLQDTVHEQP